MMRRRQCFGFASGVRSGINRPLSLERWPSGLRRTLGKRVCVKAYPGFESLSLRQLPTESRIPTLPRAQRHRFLQHRPTASVQRTRASCSADVRRCNGRGHGLFPNTRALAGHCPPKSFSERQFATIGARVCSYSRGGCVTSNRFRLPCKSNQKSALLPNTRARIGAVRSVTVRARCKVRCRACAAPLSAKALCVKAIGSLNSSIDI